MQQKSQRFIELDIARCLAIGLMIAYHFVYDVQTYYGWNAGLHSLAWSLVEKISVGTFLLLTGLCFVISWQSSPNYAKYARRGVEILCYGLLISIVTYFFDPLTYVRFGILHLIGVATLLMPLFLPLRRFNAVIGLLMIILGPYMVKISVTTSLLLPLGLMPPNFQSVDYFPVIPWMGAILIGMAFGRQYAEKEVTAMPGRHETMAGRLIVAVSKRSLLIYMVHQPVLLLILRIVLGEGE